MTFVWCLMMKKKVPVSQRSQNPAVIEPRLFFLMNTCVFAGYCMIIQNAALYCFSALKIAVSGVG